jgi:two-component system, OmpR family, phosphate regulon sensor histidine kinase PhoR
MKWLLAKIALAITLMQFLLLAVTTASLGFSTLLLIAAFVGGLGVLLFCYYLLKPLESLVALAPRMAVNRGSVSDDQDPFDLIRDAIQARQDLLDRQSIKQAEYQEWFEAVLSGMAEGVIAIDAEGNILFLNRAARSILSLDLPQAVGKPLIGLVRYEAVRLATREALETLKVVNTNFQTYSSRNRREVRLRVAPMAGQPVSGMTLVFQDITELKRLETIRRDFVANASHELKTPLSSIKAIAETLLMGAINKQPENLRFVQQIDQQADILSRQVHDLLQLARIESDLKALSAEPVDLEDVSRESLHHFQDEAQQKAVQLLLESLPETDAGGCFVWADHDSIRTILDNLVSNALRYSYHHGAGRRKAQVTVVLGAHDGECTLEVRDNGIGIAPEHQARIFERFFRVDTARSREQGGTGLGLAIVKHLVHSFDGKIEVQSKLGIGSSFRCTFPRYVSYKTEKSELDTR